MPDPSKPRRWRPRFSLSTLLVLALFAGSAGLLWQHWDPWAPGLVLPKPARAVPFACFSAGGKHVFVLDDSMARIFDARTGALIFEYAVLEQDNYREYNRTLAFTPDGPLFLTSVSRNEKLPPYPGEADIGRPLKQKVTFEIIDTPLTDAVKLVEKKTGAKIEFSPCVSEEIQKTPINLRVSDLNADLYLEWVCKLAECEVDYSQGKVLLKTKSEYDADFNNAVAVRNAENNTIVSVIPGTRVEPKVKRFCGNGKFVEIDDKEGNSLIYEIKTGKCLLQLTPESHPYGVSDWAVSQNGRFAAGYTHNKDAAFFEVWDLANGKPFRTINAPENFYGRDPTDPVILFSPDGRYMVLLDQIWETEQDAGPRIQLNGVMRANMAFTPDGQKLIVSVSDQVLIFSFDRHAPHALGWPAARKFGFSPDGSKMLCAGNDNDMELWDAKCENRLFQFPPPKRRYFWEKEPDSGIVAFAPAPPGFEDNPAHRFSPDGESILAGSDELTIWHRRRPEDRWGIAWLWEFWLAVALAMSLIWSIARDRRILAPKK